MVESPTKQRECPRCLREMPKAGCCLCVGYDDIMANRLRIEVRKLRSDTQREETR